MLPLLQPTVKPIMKPPPQHPPVPQHRNNMKIIDRSVTGAVF